jgi:hypothetical protein
VKERTKRREREASEIFSDEIYRSVLSDGSVECFVFNFRARKPHGKMSLPVVPLN